MTILTTFFDEIHFETRQKRDKIGLSFLLVCTTSRRLGQNEKR